jgi:hypothetical protein
VINNSGFGERVKILEYAPGSSHGEPLYVERYGDSTSLVGWHDAGDLLTVGDFVGSGHDQVLFLNAD